MYLGQLFDHLDHRLEREDEALRAHADQERAISDLVTRRAAEREKPGKQRIEYEANATRTRALAE